MFGLMDWLEPYLKQVFDGGRFTREGWHHFVGIHDRIYRELYLEFFSTLYFDKDVEDWHDQMTLTFRLGGVA